MADEADELEIEQPDPEIDEEQDAPEDEGEDVVFGDEAPPAPESDNAVIRHLREKLKEANARVASAPAAQPVELGPKPTLESCEFDADKFETELDAWKEREQQTKQQQAKAGESSQAFQQEWQRDHQSYQAKRGALKFTDVDEVEGIATAVLSPAQQVAIVQACKNPALVLYALGKHSGKLADVASITNPIKFGVAVADLERTLAVKPRSRAPDPEVIPTGTARISHESGDKKEAGLLAAAQKDPSKMQAYRDFMSRKRKAERAK